MLVSSCPPRKNEPSWYAHFQRLLRFPPAPATGYPRRKSASGFPRVSPAVGVYSPRIVGVRRVETEMKEIGSEFHAVTAPLMETLSNSSKFLSIRAGEAGSRAYSVNSLLKETCGKPMSFGFVVGPGSPYWRQRRFRRSGPACPPETRSQPNRNSFTRKAKSRAFRPPPRSPNACPVFRPKPAAAPHSARWTRKDRIHSR